MAQSDIRRSGADPSGKADGKLSGFTIDPGPYEATVVGHVENTRSGQLIVTIADWGGFVPDQNQGPNADQIVVSYASPFYGKRMARTPVVVQIHLIRRAKVMVCGLFPRMWAILYW